MDTSCCNCLLISLGVKYCLRNITDINTETLESQKFSCQNPTSSTNIVHLLHKGLFNLKREEDFQDSFTLPEKWTYKLVSQKSEVGRETKLPPSSWILCVHWHKPEQLERISSAVFHQFKTFKWLGSLNSENDEKQWKRDVWLSF